MAGRFCVGCADWKMNQKDDHGLCDSETSPRSGHITYGAESCDQRRQWKPRYKVGAQDESEDVEE